MTIRARRIAGLWLLVLAIALAVHVGAPFPGGALLAVGVLGVSGVIMIARTGALS